MTDLSAWVQAGASIVLIGITWRYVVLTGRLTETAASQTRLLENQGRVDRELRLAGALMSVVRLKSALESLPGPESEPRADRMIRQAAVWTSAELDAFALGTSRLGTEVATVGARVVGDLAWIGDRAREIQATPRERAYDYSRFPWPDWHRKISDAQDGLSQIESAIADAHAMAK